MQCAFLGACCSCTASRQCAVQLLFKNVLSFNKITACICCTCCDAREGFICVPRLLWLYLSVSIPLHQAENAALKQQVEHLQKMVSQLQSCMTAMDSSSMSNPLVMGSMLPMQC